MRHEDPCTFTLHLETLLHHEEPTCISSNAMERSLPGMVP
jgi:hypothetical protein